MPAPSRRRVGVLVLTLGLAAVLTACSSAGASPSAAPSTAPSVAPASPSVAPSDAASPSPAAAFPITITDDEGTAVEIPADPERIVSLTPATTEILFALGAGGDVVATDSGSDFPAEAAALPDVASFEGVDVEAIVGLDADLVLAGGLGFTSAEGIARLRELGIPVAVLYAPTVEAVFDDIALVGEAVGETEAATTVVDDMRTEMEAITAAVAAGQHPRTFYEVGYTDTTGEIYGPADDSFVADMVTRAGGDAITTGDPMSYAIPLEKLIEADPQLIVIGTNAFYAPAPADVAARPGWDVMTAVKDGGVIPVDDTEISRPGPRLADGLRILAGAIRPDVTLPAAP